MNASENGPTPPDVLGMRADVNASRYEQYVARGSRFDLVHDGRPSVESMTARLDAFMFKNRTLVEQREAAELTATVIRMRGWYR